jgi:hypothetical protein
LSTIEDKALDLIMAWERKNGRNPTDVHRQGVGYDIRSESASERRCIEVKSRSKERQTFVTMDGGLLKRLGADVSNYYLYFIRNVESSRPTLRIVPPGKVLSNLATTVRFTFAIAEDSMKGIDEFPLNQTRLETKKLEVDHPGKLPSVNDPVTKAVYEYVRRETSGVQRLLTSTQVRDEMAKSFPSVRLRKHIRGRLRELVDLGLVEERKSIKGTKQRIYLYRAIGN